jgi:hypothetical protein
VDREDERWEEVDVLLFKSEVMRAIIVERKNQNSRLNEAVEAVYERCDYLKATARDRFTVPPPDDFRGLMM